MGYDRFHTIIITTYDQQYLEPLAQQIDFLRIDATPPQESKMNGWLTVFVIPDGSKEGWDDSDVGDGQRNQLIEWLDKQRFEDGSSPYKWAEVQYGDDEGESLVTRHSDEQHRIDAANKEST